jgi:hypothetical protein
MCGCSYAPIFDAATILKAGAALDAALTAASPAHPGDDPGPAQRVMMSSLNLYLLQPIRRLDLHTYFAFHFALRRTIRTVRFDCTHGLTDLFVGTAGILF